jgi:Zn finger protein HypA/HybF involved in hydrogenase expression
MHDYHAIEALVEWLTQEPDADQITEVHIDAEAIYSPDALLQAYELLTKDTPLEGSVLVVREARREWECLACRLSWTISPADVVGHMLVCPSCGAASSIEGRGGIEVVSVSLEEPDPGC